MLDKLQDLLYTLYSESRFRRSVYIQEITVKNIYLVKDLASISGNSVYTIKYYIKFGLIEAFGRSPTTGFRYFSDDALKRLKKIRDLRRNKISLSEIKREICI